MYNTPAVYLATINENNEPEIRAVENLRCKEKFPHEASILEKHEKDPLVNYISTNTSSNKIKHIKENSSISMYYCKPEEHKGIMLKGKVEIIDDMDLKKEIWREECIRYYPKGYTDPDFTLLKLKPVFLKSWFGWGVEQEEYKDE